jgi:flagellar biosynthesis component FlhA
MVKKQGKASDRKKRLLVSIVSVMLGFGVTGTLASCQTILDIFAAFASAKMENNEKQRQQIEERREREEERERRRAEEERINREEEYARSQ